MPYFRVGMGMEMGVKEGRGGDEGTRNTKKRALNNKLAGGGATCRRRSSQRHPCEMGGGAKEAFQFTGRSTLSSGTPREFPCYAIS